MKPSIEAMERIDSLRDDIDWVAIRDTGEMWVASIWMTRLNGPISTVAAGIELKTLVIQ